MSLLKKHKCRCGNQMGMPRVSPFPITRVVEQKGKKETVHLLFMGGMSLDGLCWFCKFPNVGVRR